MSQNSIDSLLTETRRFAPDPAFAASRVAGPELYESAAADRLGYWADRARELHWHRPFQTVLDWSDPPFAKWFADGQLNVAYNCLDRHVLAGLGDRVAIHWEGEPGDSRTITYAELTAEVKRAANALAALGVGQGDRVAIYLPMIPEAVVAMLAVARLGAIHSVVFGGFSAESLRARIEDAEAKLVITADGGYRKGKVFPLKATVDTALEGETSVEHVVVVKRGGNEVAWTEGRDLWWDEAMADADLDHEAQGFDAESPLFILYTSGTTGKPKGILHTSGGYLTQAAATHHDVFDLHPETDVYWCTADIGWVTGHSYVVYGPLANGATQLMYEGTPDTPHPGRWWELIQKYGVTILYTAPTAIRSFMKLGRQIPQQFDLSSLRLLGSVGEPINPEAWVWYRDVIGGGATPIVDTWWQTETGAAMITGMPGAIDMKPGSASLPMFGVVPELVDGEGALLEGPAEGNLCIAQSWPGQMRTVWGDHERFFQTYFTHFRGKYFSGDGCRRDEDGYYWITGRIDDVINVSGHRMGTAEIESALVAHEHVAEAAVVGMPHEIKGQGIYAYVTCNADVEPDEALRKELIAWVRREIGPIATPDVIQFAPGLPKTRSGKIMRRILRKVAENDYGSLGDTSTLADPSVVSNIIDNRQNR